MAPSKKSYLLLNDVCNNLTLERSEYNRQTQRMRAQDKPLGEGQYFSADAIVTAKLQGVQPRTAAQLSVLLLHVTEAALVTHLAQTGTAGIPG